MIARLTAALPLLLCIGLLSGCGVLRQYTPYIAAASAGDGAVAVTNPFDYDPTPIELDNHDLHSQDDAHYQVKQLQFPSVGDNGQPGKLVTARYYKSKKPGEKKLLIVLPIWGSYTYPSDVISAGILSRARGDTNVLMILGENFLIDWAAMGQAQDEAGFLATTETMGRRLQNSVIDIRRFIDWAQDQEDIDSEHVGLIGFSLGALVGSLVVLNDDRLSAAVLVMGAADFSQIMATCEGRPGAAREEVTQHLGWSAEQYRRRVNEAMGYLNPVNFGGGADASRVLMVDAHFDDCMPRSARDALWHALGEPERYTFMLGHKTAFLFMTPVGANYMRYKIYNFLEWNL